MVAVNLKLLTLKISAIWFYKIILLHNYMQQLEYRHHFRRNDILLQVRLLTLKSLAKRVQSDSMLLHYSL